MGTIIVSSEYFTLFAVLCLAQFQSNCPSCLSINDFVAITSGLASVVGEYRSIGVVVLLTHCKAALREMILGSGVIDSIPPNALFISNHDAVLFCINAVNAEQRAPLAVSAMRATTTGNDDGDDETKEDASEIVSVVDVTEIYVV